MKHNHLIIYIAISSLIMLASCTGSSSENSTVEPAPPVSSTLVLTDITLAPSGGATSRYTDAEVTIEENLIIVSNLTNHFDTTRTETLRVSIADGDDPVAYTVEPEFIDIATNELNPDGTNAVTNILADHTFTLTPANGDAAITYTISLRFSESPPISSPLVLTDIVLMPSGGDASRYNAATVAIEENLIIVSNITNHFDTIRTETLRISIADTDRPVAYTIEPGFITIAANELNPDGTAAVTNTLADREFTLTLANGDAAITYTVSLRFSESPPISSPLALTDIVLTPSGGATSRYTEATVAIEEDLIIISNITNHFDTTRTETLRVSIADADDPVAYTIEPGFITIATNELNPDGTAAVTNILADHTFTLTPANGDAAITYTVSLRFSELEVVMLTPLSAEDIEINTASHLAYANASVLSVSDNIVKVGGIKNRTNGFNQALMLTIADKTDPSEYTVAGGSTVTLAGTEINPTGTAAITTATNEALTFTVMPTADNASPVKYYVVLVLGDLIQLEFPSRDNGGDIINPLSFTEGIAPFSSSITVKNCGVFPPLYSVLVGGTDMTAAYTLTATVINPYVQGSYTGGVLTLTDGITSLTFALPTVMTSACRVGDLSGSGTSTAPYIIDNDRKLNLVAKLVNETNMTYGGSHYRVTRDIDLAKPFAPWSEAQGGQFTPIGDTNADGVVFSGTFDCQGNVISNLYINTTGRYKGLFGVVGTTGMITNCGLVKANVTVREFSASYVGSLVGLLDTGGTIAKSYSEQATVTITGTPNGKSTHLGGLVGDNAGTISNSYSTGTVSNSGEITGGLVGINVGAISQSYSSADVSGYEHVGGLIGVHNSGSGIKIEDSYAAGNVTATFRNAGGLVGTGGGTVNNSYATGKVSGASFAEGLIGTGASGITASYWDTVTSGQTAATNGAAVGRTTTQMQVAAPVSDGDDAVYVGWSTTVWDFRAGAYPRLKSVACATRQYTTDVTSACADIP
ncbi:hypothetical protein COTS27_00559 [Spirochaetota bacterium]|nr:hypothetical protein COTS27_00559 [Spirochaetota bacterium]